MFATIPRYSESESPDGSDSHEPAGYRAATSRRRSGRARPPTRCRTRPARHARGQLRRANGEARELVRLDAATAAHMGPYELNATSSHPNRLAVITPSEGAPVEKGMSCDILTIDRTLVVRWMVPTLGDVRRLLVEVDRATTTVGPTLLFLGIIPLESTPPAAEVRKAMDHGFAHACTVCVSLHFLVEGEGFKHSALRAILVANIMVSGRRGKAFIASTSQGLVSGAPTPETARQLAIVLARARAQGLVARSLAPLAHPGPRVP